MTSELLGGAALAGTTELMLPRAMASRCLLRRFQETMTRSPCIALPSLQNALPHPRWSSNGKGTASKSQELDPEPPQDDSSTATSSPPAEPPGANPDMSHALFSAPSAWSVLLRRHQEGGTSTQIQESNSDPPTETRAKSLSPTEQLLRLHFSRTEPEEGQGATLASINPECEPEALSTAWGDVSSDGEDSLAQAQETHEGGKTALGLLKCDLELVSSKSGEESGDASAEPNGSNTLSSKPSSSDGHTDDLPSWKELIQNLLKKEREREASRTGEVLKMEDVMSQAGIHGMALQPLDPDMSATRVKKRRSNSWNWDMMDEDPLFQTDRAGVIPSKLEGGRQEGTFETDRSLHQRRERVVSSRIPLGKASSKLTRTLGRGEHGGDQQRLFTDESVLETGSGELQLQNDIMELIEKMASAKPVDRRKKEAQAPRLHETAVVGSIPTSRFPGKLESLGSSAHVTASSSPSDHPLPLEESRPLLPGELAVAWGGTGQESLSAVQDPEEQEEEEDEEDEEDEEEEEEEEDEGDEDSELDEEEEEEYKEEGEGKENLEDSAEGNRISKEEDGEEEKVQEVRRSGIRDSALQGGGVHITRRKISLETWTPKMEQVLGDPTFRDSLAFTDGGSFKGTFGVFLPDIPKDTEKVHLKQALARFGDINTVMVRPATSTSNPYGVVYFKSLDAFHAAMKQGGHEINGSLVFGKTRTETRQRLERAYDVASALGSGGESTDEEEESERDGNEEGEDGKGGEKKESIEEGNWSSKQEDGEAGGWARRSSGRREPALLGGGLSVASRETSTSFDFWSPEMEQVLGDPAFREVLASTDWGHFKGTFGLFLPDVPPNTQEGHLIQALAKFGDIDTTTVRAASGTSNPYGMVYFKSLDAFHAAMKQGGHVINGSIIICRTRTETRRRLERALVIASLAKNRGEGIDDFRVNRPSNSWQDQPLLAGCPDDRGSVTSGGGMFSSKAVVVQDVPAHISMGHVMLSFQQLGRVAALQMSCSKKADKMDVTALFESDDDAAVAATNKYLRLKGERLPIALLNSDTATASHSEGPSSVSNMHLQPVIRISRISGDGTPPLESIRIVCNHLAPVAVLRPRSTSIVDVTFEAESRDEQPTADQVSEALFQAGMGGWLCRKVMLPSVEATSSSNPAHKTKVDGSAFKTLSECRLSLERVLVDIEDMLPLSLPRQE